MIERVWSKAYYFIPPILYTIFFGFLIVDGNDLSEIIATIRGADPWVSSMRPCLPWAACS